MVILLSWLGHHLGDGVAGAGGGDLADLALHRMLIGAQSFQETPKSHAPAIILALIPHLAAWGKLQIDGALHAAGTSVAPSVSTSWATKGSCTRACR
jgi:AGZA family xanthine/uracil permease-like MFS transporter